MTAYSRHRVNPHSSHALRIFALLVVVVVILSIDVFSSSGSSPTQPPTTPVATMGSTRDTKRPKWYRTLEPSFSEKEDRDYHSAIVTTAPTSTRFERSIPCEPVTEVDILLLAKMKRFVSSSHSTPCIDSIEPLNPLLPFRVRDQCRTNQPRWLTVHEYISHYDWTEVQLRKKTAKLLLSDCPPRTAHHFVYFDIGSQTLGRGIEWFRRHYPRSSEFLCYAWDWSPFFNSQSDRNFDGVRFRRAIPWNQTGYVTIVLDQVAEDYPGDDSSESQRQRFYIQELLRRRPTLKYFHQQPQFDLNRDVADAPVVEPERLLVVEASSIADALLLHVTAADFVVMRLDADGDEWKLLDHLIQTGALKLVDELLLVCHNVELDALWPVDVTVDECHRLLNTLRAAGVYAHEWYR